MKASAWRIVREADRDTVLIPAGGDTWHPLDGVLPPFWIGSHVGLRLVQAFKTLGKMPMNWPRYRHEWEDLLAQEEAAKDDKQLRAEAFNRVRIPPTAIEVGNMETAIVWPARYLALIANLSSLTLDFLTRQKVSGSSMTYFYVEQFPVLPPSVYTETDLTFILPRVLELVYIGHSIAPFARDLGYGGPPFAWDEERRAQLRAELEAWYAHAYGLTRDDVRYVLDPADVKGPDYPSETFRVLKKNEITRFGEYRTARLVLAAYDQLAAHPLAAE